MWLINNQGCNVSYFLDAHLSKFNKQSVKVKQSSKQNMVLITFLVESLSTEFTHKWFVSGVDARVCVQSGAPVKCFPTLMAFMRLFLQTNNKE